MKDIIAENKKYVRSVIRRMIGENNEDIEQEVYIKTWQNLSKYQEKGKFRQWISMLTANQCRDYFRSKSFRNGQLNVNDDTISDKQESFVPIEETIDAKYRQKIILNAVDRLPKVYREVVVLFEFEDLSLESIAKRLKIPLGTVKSRLYHARKILNKDLSFLKGENK